MACVLMQVQFVSVYLGHFCTTNFLSSLDPHPRLCAGLCEALLQLGQLLLGLTAHLHLLHRHLHRLPLLFGNVS